MAQVFLNANKKKRILVGSILAISSLLCGLVLGMVFKSPYKEKENNNSFSELSNFLEKNWYSEIYYGKEVDGKILINQFIGALSTDDSRLLDPYTYLTKKKSNVVNTTLGKIGITLSNYYNYPVVVNIDERGKAGGIVEVGDIVLQVNDSKISDSSYSYSSLFSANLSEPGTTINLKVARFDDEGKATIKDLEIELVKQSDVVERYSTLEKSSYLETNMENNSPLIVKLSSFNGSEKSGTCNDLKVILQNNANKEIPKKDLVIDLLDNGGGDLSSVVGICDLFLPKDKLVTTLQYKDQTTKSYYTSDDYEFSFDNIVILVNGKTASASEILISTLLYYFEDKVTLVGSKTYGKGIATTTKTSVNLFGGEYTLNYTCAKWLRPDGSWMGMKGSAIQEPTLFTPDTAYTISKDDLLTTMDSYATYLNFKDQQDGLVNDKVSTTNVAFAKIYNETYGANLRTDGYFDDAFTDAIKDYQTLKHLDVTGVMDQLTYVYFIKDYFDKRQQFMDLYYQKIETILKNE